MFPISNGMEDAILNFNKQFLFEPTVEFGEKLRPAESFVLAGMGGSHLAADLLSVYNPSIDLTVHSDYGLPWMPEERTQRSLFIASSYSGNTEEVIRFAEDAHARGLNLAIISIGGRLIEFARANEIPHVVVPNSHIQPRSALGYSLIALAAVIGDRALLKELSNLGAVLDPKMRREEGERLAEKLHGKVPVIYSSARNKPVAYNWKIKFNETGKIPAFYNVFPELNHNEMAGFDIVEATAPLSEKFNFIFLSDDDDNPRIGRRMEVTENLLKERGFSIERSPLSGKTVFEKILNSLLIADWTALALSSHYGTEAEAVEIIEEFKKLIG